MKLLFFNILFLYFFLNFHFSTLEAQKLNHRLGEFIIKLEKNSKIEQVLTQSNLLLFTKSDLTVKKCISKEWKLWLLQSNYVLSSEIDLLQSLKQNQHVEIAQFNHILESRKSPNDPLYRDQWYHRNFVTQGHDMSSEQAWEVSTGGITEDGDTIVTCVIDGGIDITHEDLSPVIWKNFNEVPNNKIDDDQNGYIDDFLGWNTFNQSDVFVADNHGTAVAGIAASKGNNSKGISSLSWDSKLVFVSGGSDEANAIESYTYPWTLRRMYNNSNGKKGAFIVTANSSWGRNFGRPEESPLWCAIYDSLGKVGILSVAATANGDINVDVEGDLPTSCISPYLVTVTNIDQDNHKVSDAAYGQLSIDIGAYGENVISTKALNNNYATFSGTSFASPQVSSSVALLYSIPCNSLNELSKSNPALAVLEVKKMILNGAIQNSDLFQKTTTGGILNIYNSILQTSPLQTIAIEQNKIQFQFNATTLLYPILFQYKSVDTNQWQEIIIRDNSLFELSNLLTCHEYEFRFKGGCPRFNLEYSPIQKVRTKGCCEKIKSISYTNISSELIELNFESNSTGDTSYCLLRIKNTIPWDTFIYLRVNNKLTLPPLHPCNSYEVKLISVCRSGQTYPESDIIEIKTRECNICDVSTICPRRPLQSNLEWIESISINNSKIITGNNKGFGNFISSNKTWKLVKNQPNTIEIQAGYSVDTSIMNTAVYIDYNRDGDLVYDIVSTTHSDTFRNLKKFEFTIPSTAKSGICRMRVICKYAEFNATAPTFCGQSLEFGEYEDYCIYILDQSCEENFTAITKNINSKSCTIELNSSDRFAYRVREKYSPNWSNFISSSSPIQLDSLQECTNYEVELKMECEPTEISKKIQFKTIGQNCISKQNTYQKQEITIYPNPFTNRITILNANNILKLKIYNSKGNLIKSISTTPDSKKEISLDETPPGLYFIQCTDANNNTEIFRMIKSK